MKSNFASQFVGDPETVSYIRNGKSASVLHSSSILAGKSNLEIAVESEKDRLAEQVVDLRARFDQALSDKREYPIQEFKSFAQAVRRYIEVSADNPMIHKSVVGAVNGLREFPEAERKRTPGGILFEADRLECQVFDGYDPKFEGNEPPGL